MVIYQDRTHIFTQKAIKGVEYRVQRRKYEVILLKCPHRIKEGVKWACSLYVYVFIRVVCAPVCDACARECVRVRVHLFACVWCTYVGVWLASGYVRH